MIVLLNLVQGPSNELGTRQIFDKALLKRKSMIALHCIMISQVPFCCVLSDRAAKWSFMHVHYKSYDDDYTTDAQVFGLRPYHEESSCSRPITEDKPHRAYPVLGWATALEQ